MKPPSPEAEADEKLARGERVESSHLIGDIEVVSRSPTDSHPIDLIYIPESMSV